MRLNQLRERCTKRFMILTVISLGLLTILLLILENALTKTRFDSATPSPLNSASSSAAIPAVSAPSSKSDSSPCWLKEPSAIVRRCTSCTEFQINTRSDPACLDTGLKELVNCTNTGTLVYRSCSQQQEIEKRNFLVFESLMFLFAILAYGAVRIRTSQLDRLEAERITKRLARG